MSQSMTGSIIPAHQQQFRRFNSDLSAAIDSYSTTRSQAALLAALKIQTKMMDLLLASNNLQTAQTLHRSSVIQNF
jgi:hypothetical protein